MELPSINSTTSISDNAALKNYYENLLFKNSSGKSLADLPRKLANFDKSSNDGKHQPPPSGTDPKSTAKVDFINGYTKSSWNKDGIEEEDQFKMMSPPSSHNTPQRSPFAHTEPNFSLFSFNFGGTASEGNVQQSQNRPERASLSEEVNGRYYASLQDVKKNPNTQLHTPDSPTGINSPAVLGPPSGRKLPYGTNYFTDSSFSTTRRSSYISDALIHGNTIINSSFSPNLTNIYDNEQDHLNSPTRHGAYRSSISHDLYMNEENNNSNGQVWNSYTSNDGNYETPVEGGLPNSAIDGMAMAGYGIASFNSSQQYQMNPLSPYSTTESLAEGTRMNFNTNYRNADISYMPTIDANSAYEPVQGVRSYVNRSDYMMGDQISNKPTFPRRRASTQFIPQEYVMSGIYDMNGNPHYHADSRQFNGKNQMAYKGSSGLNGQRIAYMYDKAHNGYSGIPNTLEFNISNSPKENGFCVVNGRFLASSAELQQTYSRCGSNYFSSKEVYEFTDYIKSMLCLKSDKSTSKANKSIHKFLGFLKSCNLNYNPQSDAFISKDKSTNGNVRYNNGDRRDSTGKVMDTNRRTSNSTSSYLHYKPLVLVALKNGKLELLSTPQKSNLSMKRGDMVIIDGDRGKDLVLVVEPHVDLDLALFVNFLKKKIHFDSLITDKKAHYPNKQFIQALIDSTKGQGDELSHKLYDVIELTQLIVPSKQVLRFATSWEVSTNLHHKFQDELKALYIAQLKLKSLNSGLTHHLSTGNEDFNRNPQPNGVKKLNIKILNSEFQFDRKKLTFYYICEERNDFRELIKELFKFYKTRIWLCAIPNNLAIDAKYYDKDKKELAMYQDMMQHYSSNDLSDFQPSGASSTGNETLMNNNSNDGFVVAPPLDKLQLDNFQIGVYRELVRELFG